MSTPRRPRALEPAHFPWFDYSRYTFSLGLELGGRAWLSGHSASEHDPESGHIVVRGSMADQTRTAYAKIAAILGAADLALRDATRIVEYVTTEGIEHYAEAASVRDEILGGRVPAVSTVVVNRLLRPQALIEVEVTAGPAGDLVYLPSVAAAGPAEAFAAALALLGQLDLGREHVAKTVWYTAPGTAEPPSGPAASTHVILSRLQHPGVRVSLDVVASRAPLEQNGGAVRTGDVVLVSGATGAGDDVASQAGDAIARVIASLAAFGGRPEHLVKTIEYVTPDGLARYREVAGVREKLLVSPYPASTGAVCESLPAPGAQFLVDALAVL